MRVRKLFVLIIGLEIRNLQMKNEATGLPPHPIHFRYLTHLKLAEMVPDPFGRQICQLLFSACPDLEILDVSFQQTATFFSDFFLDDILCSNPMGRLESFQMKNASLTLISALRLLNCRPKLTRIGHILKWDVEPVELDTFAQIVNKAKSLNLLQNVVFL